MPDRLLKLLLKGKQKLKVKMMWMSSCELVLQP